MSMNMNTNGKSQLLKFDSRTKESLLQWIPKLSQVPILVVGDIGVDEYITGSVQRISPEAPVPILDVELVQRRLGLAGNVAQNITSLGGTCDFLSVVGADESGRFLKEQLEEFQIPSSGLLIDESRPTVRKARVMSQHHHLIRIDYETKQRLSAGIEDLVWLSFQSKIGHAKACIIEDYAKGLLSRSLLEKIFAACAALNVPVFVDPSRHQPLSFYKGCTVFKPNWEEAHELTRHLLPVAAQSLNEKVADAETLATALQKETEAQSIVITQGKEGMIFLDHGHFVRVPTLARQVFDVTGAGDTVIATLALARAAGMPLELACWLANFAAGYVVGQVGSVPCPHSELVKYIQATQIHLEI